MADFYAHGDGIRVRHLWQVKRLPALPDEGETFELDQAVTGQVRDHELVGGPVGFIRKQLDPGRVNGAHVLAALQEEAHLRDLVDRAASPLDDMPQVREGVGHLLLYAVADLPGGEVDAADARRVDQVANPSAEGQWVDVRVAEDLLDGCGACHCQPPAVLEGEICSSRVAGLPILGLVSFDVDRLIPVHLVRVGEAGAEGLERNFRKIMIRHPRVTATARDSDRAHDLAIVYDAAAAGE